MKQQWICLFVVLTLCLTGAALAEQAVTDPDVVIVGDVHYALSEVQPVFKDVLKSHIASGLVTAKDTYAEVAQEVIQGFIDEGVMAMLYAEFGLDRLSEP